MTTLQGKFVWFELVTRDAKKAQAFYGEVLGWKVAPMSLGADTYEMITAGDTPIGGYTALEGKGAPHWTSFVSVPDVDQAVERARQAGGTLVDAAMDVPTVGRMAKIADPAGATLWLFRSASDEGDDQSGPGRFCWNELVSPDPARAVGFYEQVVGYGHRSMEMGAFGTYHVLTRGERSHGGIMKGDGPSAWLPYVAVERADATVERVTRFGGKLVAPPYDVPGVGRCATFTDPSGATLAILQPASKAG